MTYEEFLKAVRSEAEARLTDPEHIKRVSEYTLEVRPDPPPNTNAATNYDERLVMIPPWDQLINQNVYDVAGSVIHEIAHAATLTDEINSRYLNLANSPLAMMGFPDVIKAAVQISHNEEWKQTARQMGDVEPVSAYNQLNLAPADRIDPEMRAFVDHLTPQLDFV